MTQRAVQPDHSDAPEGYHDPDRNITLLLRDCLTGMREFLMPGSVDVVMTSPPYNLGINYGVYDDSIPILVPANVPSEIQSSVPFVPLLAAK